MERKLLRYRSGVFDSPTGPIGSHINAICRAKNGNLLISTMGQGALMHRQGKLEVMAAPSGLPHFPILAIAQTADASIWSGTRGAGLYRQHDRRTDPVMEGLPNLKVNCLRTGPNGDLWVGTDSGIVHWDGSRLVAAGPALPHQIQVLSIERDHDGNIWAGTDSQGLLRINERGVAYLEKPGERSRDAVTAVFEDREGNLWIGTASGIERLRDSAFVTYSQAEGLPAGGNSPVFVDAENRVWIAPVDGGLWWIEGGRRGRVPNQGLDSDVIYSIAGKQGELWLGRQRGGLTQLRTVGNSLAVRTYTKAEGLAQNSVFSVYQARDGVVWAGTLSGGVSKLSGDRFTTYTSTTGLLANTVADILEGSDGTMWFATPGGLNELWKGRWRGYTKKDGLPSDNVYSLLQDSTGVLWIGTAAGISFRSARAIETPVVAPQRLREPILGIAEDRYGSLWMATSDHVLRVNRERLLRGTLREEDVRQYGTQDGLRGTEGIRRHRSVIADATGRIWFSLNHGISVVDPARLNRNAAPVIAQVQTISADGSPIALEGPVHIPGGTRRVTFGYVGLSLSAPELVSYRYRLDEYDSRWSEPTSVREAGYTNLAPGSYRFRVRASNPDGAWDDKEAAIVVEVVPLFWQTRWFRGGAVLACFGAIVMFLRLRMRRMTRRLNLRFEERLAERTHVARDLHDTLLQSFHGLMLRLQAVEDLLPAGRAKQELERTLERADQAIAEGRNAIYALRSAATTTNDLAQALRAVGDEVTSGVCPNFRLVVEGPARDLHPVLRDEVYRIAREALRNAFSHAQAHQIEAEIIYSERLLRLRIRDDGNGISPAILEAGRPGHYGLSGMRERARQVGAKLDIWSGVGTGTEIDLSIPGSIAYVINPAKLFHLRPFRRKAG
jgi:signal transduction histidine kinase/ligand-binding sensor domain-containing protein